MDPAIAEPYGERLEIPAALRPHETTIVQSKVAVRRYPPTRSIGRVCSGCWLCDRFIDVPVTRRRYWSRT
jgi:hypothetical protein